MEFSKKFLYVYKYSIGVIILISLINSYCQCLNRTKRTVKFKRPVKWEAVLSFVSPKPGSRDRTRFYLYTRRNAEKSQELTIDNEELLLKSSFDPKLPIKIVISGWLDNRYFAKWIRSGVNSLLIHGDYNVIYVAWKSIQELFVAAFIIKMFSEDLAQFIIFLKNFYGINGEGIHCIGHSLGAFLCGFAGALTYIGRLTVLDAGPRPWYQSMPIDQRINRWQAGFVDVIHSDFNPIFSLGMTIPIGDIDFFPNWGTPQPGCMRDKVSQGIMELKDEGLVVGLFQWIRYLLFCSHYRAHEWFFESVWNEECAFIGVRCPSYEMFMNGECGCDTSPHSCAVMGMNADTVLNRGVHKYSEPGKWFIKTSDFVRETGTHCLFQYLLNIQLGQLFPNNNGTIVITIHSENGNTQEELIPPNNALIPGLRFGKLAVRKHFIFNIKGLSLSWTPLDADHHKSQISWINIEHIKVAPIQISLRKKSLVQFFCGTFLQIKSHQTIRLIPC